MKLIKYLLIVNVVHSGLVSGMQPTSSYENSYIYSDNSRVKNYFVYHDTRTNLLKFDCFINIDKTLLKKISDHVLLRAQKEACYFTIGLNHIYNLKALGISINKKIIDNREIYKKLQKLCDTVHAIPGITFEYANKPLNSATVSIPLSLFIEFINCSYGIIRFPLNTQEVKTIGVVLGEWGQEVVLLPKELHFYVDMYRQYEKE